HTGIMSDQGASRHTRYTRHRSAVHQSPTPDQHVAFPAQKTLDRKPGFANLSVDCRRNEPFRNPWPAVDSTHPAPFMLLFRHELQNLLLTECRPPLRAQHILEGATIRVNLI